METKDFFRGANLFRHLTETQLERLAGLAVEVSFPAGNIIRELDTSDGMFVIKSGRAKVSKSRTDNGGAEIELAFLHQGNNFGEIGLIDGLPRSANVTALEPVECYFLPRDPFMQALADNPEIAVAMLQFFASMVRRADNWASFS